MVTRKVEYVFFIVVNNVLALVMLGISFLGSSNDGSETGHEHPGWPGLFAYWATVAFTFSLVTMSLGFLYRKPLQFDNDFIKKTFLYQCIFLVAVPISIFIYSVHFLQTT